MISIEHLLALNSPIKYAILLLVAFFFMACHNWILRGDKNPFKRSVIELTAFKRWSLYVVLLVGTGGLMFWVAPASPFIFDGLIAIFMIPILSFFILYTLKGLLTTMREDKLLLKLFINQDFLLTVYFIMLTEFIFLNWFKELTTYVQTQFFVFVILYSVLIIVIGILLGIPEKNGGGKRLPDDWRLKSVIIAIILLDPMIVVVWASILVQITLEIILFIQ
ncbi:membrane protein [Beggiatoa sp. PS]|nr:membrane protein [Beggiatoa sp. PS]